DDRDHRRARRGRRHHAGQLHLERRPLDMQVRTSEHDLLLQIDLEDSIDGADQRSHLNRRASRPVTSALARRAEATGACPPARAARYETAKASPAPVGSIGPPTGCVATCSSRPSAYTSDPRDPSVTTTSGTSSARSAVSSGSPTSTRA